MGTVHSNATTMKFLIVLPLSVAVPAVAKSTIKYKTAAFEPVDVATPADAIKIELRRLSMSRRSSPPPSSMSLTPPPLPSDTTVLVWDTLVWDTPVLDTPVSDTDTDFPSSTPPPLPPLRNRGKQ